MQFFEYIDLMNQPYDIFCTDTPDSPMHWHYYSEILYITKGSVQVTCSNRETLLHQGDLCYFYPTQLHSVTRDPSCMEGVNYAVIKFNIQTLNIPKAYIQQLYDCFVHNLPEIDSCIVFHDEEKIPSIVEEILSEYESNDLMHILAVQTGILSLLITLARRMKPSAQPIRRQDDRNLSYYHILEYIDTHSSDSLEVQKLAEMCHMSYSHFAKVFREHYGLSCKEYIQYIRMNKAQDLLLNSEFDLDYIAQETGFYDCSHFIRQYRKWRGITPKQERMRNHSPSF